LNIDSYQSCDICQGFNLYSILNQRDKLFRELTDIKKSLEV
jgi:hypothetical protein